MTEFSLSYKPHIDDITERHRHIGAGRYWRRWPAKGPSPDVHGIFSRSSIMVELLSTFGLSIVAVVAAIIYFFSSSKRRRLPPGPPAWPVIGNLLDMPTSHEQYEYAKWSEKYGK